MNRTIMAVNPTGEFDRLVAGAEEITGNLDTRSGVTLLAVDLASSKRFLECS